MQTITSFDTIKQSIVKSFDQMVASGQILTVQHDRDLIWQTYLNAFPEELRQEHNCNCCKAFLRQIGHVVTIVNNEVRTLWDFEGEGEYAAPVLALRNYIRSCPISGIFYHNNPSVGTDKNLDRESGVVWKHMHVRLPRPLVNADGTGAARNGMAVSSVQVFERALIELTPDAVQTVLELISQGSLYRGNEFEHTVREFQTQQNQWLSLTYPQRTIAAWVKGTSTNAITHIRNSAIGTLLVDLSEGRDLETAVSAYERVVAPFNYRRPTALVTPAMVAKAKARLEELGLVSALHRRRLDARDLTADHALYVFRPRQITGDVFESLTNDAPVNPQTFSRVETVSIDTFLNDVLPHSKSVRVLVSPEHANNFVTLTGPQDPEANNLFRWDNSFGWSYTGGTADSIKEKVKRAGGRVENVYIRTSLAWNNWDDLDLHLRGRNEHVYFGSKRSDVLRAHLDVDMNAGGGQTREPVENIYVEHQLRPGEYTFSVHQYQRREYDNQGFTVELEVNGTIHRFSAPTNPNQDHDHKINLTIDAQGQVTIQTALAKSSFGVTKWGIKSGTWADVRAITLSPNHWTKPVGNKHYFFLLNGCVSDEPTRPFYNEFLVDSLQADRKTTEALAGKITVADANGAELSGLGFSDTQRNEIYVEVEGNFKRIVKVQF